MKLELKHLSCYLPYGLKMKRNGFIGELLTIKQPKEDSLVDYYEFQVSTSDWWENNVDDLNPYKPILRPLSDLTKEIEVNGETFVPIEEYDYLRLDEISTLVGGCNAMKFIQARELELLYEMHFDIYGLIEKGLAIDINTLNQ